MPSAPEPPHLQATDSDAHRQQAPASYEAAQEELTALLQALQEPVADIDALSARVARAKFLLEWSRTRLRVTEAEIDALLDVAS